MALAIHKIIFCVFLAVEATTMVMDSAFAEENPSPLASDVEAHIRRVTEGLLPAVTISGVGQPQMKLADRMDELRVPGVSIALIHHGEIQWSRGFGRTAFDGPPVTSNTLFQAASISKPVSAVAALALVQAGKLALDADVNRFLKSWKVPDNAYTDEFEGHASKSVESHCRNNGARL